MKIQSLILITLIIAPLYASTPVREKTRKLLENRSFVCREIQVEKDRLEIPEIIKSGEVSEGRIDFERVDEAMVKVVFHYKIGNFNASHSYHITGGREWHLLKDIIITEDTEINDKLRLDPFANSIGTRLKIKRSLLRERVQEIWIRKRMTGVKIPFQGKDIACKVARDTKGQNKKFKEIYSPQ